MKNADVTPERAAFLLKAMQDTLAEMELCMLALRKSHREEVLAMAETMIDEHGQLGLEMEQLAQKKKLDATLQMTEENLALIDTIAQLSERDFDRSFAQQNRKDHEEHLRMFAQCAAQEQDRDIRALAEKGEKMFSKHLQMAKELEEKVAA